MAMFLFSYNELVFLLIAYSLVIIQHGLITNNITVGASLGNIVIAGNFLQIKRPPVTRLLISQPHVAHYLPCSASINYNPYENIVPAKGFIYIWYRNGIELKTFAPRRNDFEILNNGTLRLPTNQKATGVYRCLVNATTWGHHALLSESCSVEYPVLKRISSQSNITAMQGMPITLSCPVQSIPTANVSWLYGNTSIERKLKENRFITLTNGSLVLRNVSESDRGKYKCIARNSYAGKKHRQFILTINVEPPNITNNTYKSSSKYKLLPPLQDDVHYIPSGTNLRLRCFGTSNSITIEWWFGKSLDSQNKKISNNSRDFHIREATVEKDDGYYRCATQGDAQVFQVIVTVPPVIVQPLESYESSLAAFVNFSCSAEGNPQPEFSWYHNGKPLSKDSFTINIQRNVLTIQSFDIANEGIYQCFAQNIAGETYSAALLRLSQREDLEIMPKPLRNVRCYAMNFNTINVTFHSATSLYFISVHFVQNNPYRWESKPPLQLNHSQYVVISGHMPVYKPFVILIRALLPISSHRYSHKESIEETMQSSFLSEPAHCCTQGLPVRAFHLSSDVFITWSNPALKTKYFVIQFSVALTRPHPQEFLKDSNLQGISSSVTVILIPNDIEDNLQEVIPLSESQAREVLSRAQATRNDSEDDEDVFSIIVTSNVTGLLLKNCQMAKVRVLVITNENEDLQQDFRFVQWKIIENDTQETTSVPFKVLNIDPRSISFIFTESFEEKCVQVCYFTYEIQDFGTSRQTCEDMTISFSKLVLRQLKPKKHYKILFYNCTNHIPYGEVDVQTLPDPPGTVSNHKVFNDDGLKLTWDPPKTANGRINYYSIYWTVNNVTHGANVSSNETFFKFPNITEREEVKVTVRVVGENGIGAPIYFDLRNWVRNSDDRKSILDAYLGVAIGAALSTVCILIFSLIFICQRHRFKMRSGQIQLTSQSESNIGAASTPGGNTETTGLGGFLGDGGLSGGLGESSALHEYHEMRTLIPKSQHFQFIKDMPQSPKQLPNGNGNCPRRNENSSECIFAETELDDEPITALSSSTPLSKVPPQRSSSSNDDTALYFIPVAAKNHRKNIEVEYANPKKFSDRFALNKISSSPNFFNGGSSSVSGGCRPSVFTEDCSRQRHTNRHSQRQPAAMQNGCSHYVNTTNNRNSYSSSSNNSKSNQQQPPPPQQMHPTDQLNHSIDNGVASLSEPKLFATINNGERIADSKNHALFPDDTERLFEHTQFHPTNTSTLDRNDEQMKIFNTSPASANNNNTLSWNNKQQQANDDKYNRHHHHNSSVAPLIRNNSTIGSETSSLVEDDHPSSSYPCISSNNHHHHQHHNHHHQESDNSMNNPLLKTNWNHRRPNVDPNG
ncbi:uncharacterized protein LOC129916746 [Episyrphus balteatus]|uniref:uncharacterized protein LOC129916746 n=1 Tax=Episyrphus balteatus TaxID=286459 RepID=UPI002485BBD7|nr:uncharacterized protein LOC129916746 [Episyrphus balteatus]XP_055852845.1 uncharacterized protein LOC129916746 [Episyrphus balteatus]XP_055852846.1 uncharacterized protein LOC129916746 [Episyrphus balteatus]XP_055852847.1 uncharacterized protein LOC129916746 [Episyrphus balteatus]XP_055852848.1 uncharacterized protein LOC129916746 [Episyrphus balteatus]